MLTVEKLRGYELCRTAFGKDESAQHWMSKSQLQAGCRASWKIREKARPGKRKMLASHFASIFQNKLDQSQVTRIIDMLFANELVSEANGAISYAF